MAVRAKPRGQKLARRRKKYDAFVSHTPEDAAWVNTFVSNLRSLGLLIAHSGAMQFGNRYDTAAGDMLKNSRTMLLVVSPTACCSESVRSDVRRWKNTRPSPVTLIPIDIWGYRYPDESVAGLKPTQFTYYDDSSYRDEILNLARQISTRTITASLLKFAEIPPVRYWPVSPALCQKALELVEFFEGLKSLWRTFEKRRPGGNASLNSQIQDDLEMTHLQSAYIYLDKQGGLTALTRLGKVLNGLRVDIESTSEIMGRQAAYTITVDWWSDIYSALEEAIKAEADKEYRDDEQRRIERRTQRKNSLLQKRSEKKQQIEALLQEKDELERQIRAELLEHPTDIQQARARTLANHQIMANEDLYKIEQELMAMEEVWPTNAPTWEELVSESASYEVNPFDDVVLCMHPETERAWRDAVPNARAAELRCVIIQTPEGPWHRDGKPDVGLWSRVFSDIHAKVQEARSMKAKRIHVVAMAPVSFGALLGSLLDPQNSRIVVYQSHNAQGQKDQKTWRSYGPEWSSNPGQRTEPFFERPPGLGVARPDNDSHVAVVVNITGAGDLARIIHERCG